MACSRAALDYNDIGALVKYDRVHPTANIRDKEVLRMQLS